MATIPMVMRKFLQGLDEKAYEELRKEADARHISIQELIRAVVVPEWLASFRQRSEAKSRGQP